MESITNRKEYVIVGIIDTCGPLPVAWQKLEIVKELMSALEGFSYSGHVHINESRFSPYSVSVSDLYASSIGSSIPLANRNRDVIRFSIVYVASKTGSTKEHGFPPAPRMDFGGVMSDNNEDRNCFISLHMILKA